MKAYEHAQLIPVLRMYLHVARHVGLVGNDNMTYRALTRSSGFVSFLSLSSTTIMSPISSPSAAMSSPLSWHVAWQME